MTRWAIALAATCRVGSQPHRKDVRLDPGGAVVRTRWYTVSTLETQMAYLFNLTVAALPPHFSTSVILPERHAGAR
jgi:hypothetical protein